MFIFFVIARFTSKIPIVPQIKTPSTKIPVRIQLSPHVVIALNRQLNAIIIVPYFSLHFANFEELSLLKLSSLPFLR